MKLFGKLIIVMIFSLILNCKLLSKTQNQPENSLIPDSLIIKVDKIFTEWDKPASPGCAIAIIREGNIIYKKGYGSANLEYDIPITPQSVFYLASVSKQFTDMCIALLATEKRLSLDDDVRKYIPEVPDFGLPIKISHLIYHTSGLREIYDLLNIAGWREDDVITEDDVLECVKKQKSLNFKPGEKHLYCNTGYILLSIILRRLTGKSLREYADSVIFRPLGMLNTQYRDDHTTIVKNRAYAYQPRKGGGYKISIPMLDFVGSGGIYSTVEDLAKWDKNFYDKKIGGEKVFDLMHTTGTLNSGEILKYAFGNAIGEYRGLKTVEHSGGMAGYRTYLLRFPDEKFSVVILCNLSTLIPEMFAKRIAEIFLKGRMEPRKKDQRVIEVKDMKAIDQMLTEKQSTRYSGTYYNDGLDVKYYIIAKNHKLLLRRNKYPDQELEFSGNDSFNIKNFGDIQFQCDKRNEINGFLLSTGGALNLEFSKISIKNM